ncbi:unnamed protein product [Dibothriocephalus latus]|uniref:Mitochondrial folate transporter/carrier n=1 Tax=Dibothriocephalus latus TaxID=60516 RepID=A0A3P6V2R5_DIBLA|nr:unnamed protein product [Dibothriocephalus latus]
MIPKTSPGQETPQKEGYTYLPHCFLPHVRWEQFIAGLAGGAISTLALHPLDLAKVRLQVNEGTGAVNTRPRSARMIGTLSEVYKARGLLGLYQGITPNLLGAASAWGLYFFIYGAMKDHAQEGDPSRKLKKMEYLGYAYLSGCLVLSLTNPIWVVKTRMCLQYETLATQRVPTLTTWGNLVSLWRMEGIKGLYRGFVPSLVGMSNGAIQFLVYEEMRNYYNGTYFHRPIDTHLSPFEYLTMATVSKAIAVAATSPFQVLRSRLQEQHRSYGGIMDVITSIWRYEGLLGFYKGLWPGILRTAPACGITFVVYENANKWLKPKPK